MQLSTAYTTLRRYKQAFRFLVAFLLYNDGVGTIIRMAVVYGTEIGLPQESLITAILMVQFVGVPFAFLFGRLAHYLGSKRAIALALAVYVVVTVPCVHRSILQVASSLSSIMGLRPVRA